MHRTARLAAADSALVLISTRRSGSVGARLLSTVMSDRLAPLVPLARRQFPLWAGALAVLAALIVGFLLGRSGDS